MSIPKYTMDKGSITQKLSVSNKTFLAGFDWCWKNVIDGITDGMESNEKLREHIMRCVETSRERMVATMIANAEESRENPGE